MRIEFGLLSALSVCVLLFFGFQGDVELYSWEVGVAVSPDEVKMMVDPVWVVWTDLRLPQNALGATFGNVAIVKKALRGSDLGEYVRDYELNHVEQYHALGWWIYPLSLLIPIEATPASPMWLPPDWRVNQWRFVAIVDDKFL